MRSAKEVYDNSYKIRDQIRQEIFLVYLKRIESRIDSEEIIWELALVSSSIINVEDDLEEEIKKINQKYIELLHVKELQLEEDFYRVFEELRDEAFERVETHLKENGWRLLDEGDHWILEEIIEKAVEEVV